VWFSQDGESGWSSLHRALHFGHLAVAAVLVEAGASLVLEDTKGRTPIDLLSGPVQQAVANPENAGGNGKSLLSIQRSSFLLRSCSTQSLVSPMRAPVFCTCQ